MARHRLSQRAEDELLDIYVFGATQFGRSQALAYQIELEDCFEMLNENPRMGRLTRLRADVRRHEHGSHVILYREERVTSSSLRSFTAEASAALPSDP